MTRLIPRLAVVIAGALVTLAAAPQAPPFGGAAALRADLAARRSNVMTTLGPETVAILWSAPSRVYSTDVDYEYRQESNLLYLTALEQQETVLVMIPGAKTMREFVFVLEPNPVREHWDGHRLRHDEVTARSGVANVLPVSAFEPFLKALLSGQAGDPLPADAAAEFAAFTTAMAGKTAKIAMLLERGGGGRGAGDSPPPPPGSRREFGVSLQKEYPGLTITDLTPVVHTQRQVKTSYEQALLRRSVEISAEAHLEGMKTARPGRWEYEVEAAIEHWYLKNGAMSWGYPSIVGSGPNATVLHYNASSRQMQNGDLLLVDAAANFQGLTGDITRTYPINGRFTPAQREIYEMVLRAQDAGIAAARIGSPASAITQACRTVMAEGLQKLGLITDPAQVGTWFTHGPVHGIGYDVHDPFNLTAPLEPGMTFVIEPGVYFREDSLQNIGRSGGRGRGAPPVDNSAIVAAVKPAFEKYKNIGVRIEDSFLMTKDGPVNLSMKAPRQIADIERVVGTGR